MKAEVEDVLKTFDEFHAFVGVDLHIFLATARGDINDPFRKPNTGMWELFSSLSDRPFDLGQSFFVGNSAGRKGDPSSVDADFARRVGLAFYTEDWLQRNTHPTD